MGLLPLSQRKDAFVLTLLPDKQLCYCFGCKKGGGVINFIMEEENLSFPDAVRVSGAAREHASCRRKRRARIRPAGRGCWSSTGTRRGFSMIMLVSPQGAPAQDYVRRRAISPAMVTRFGLGFAPDSWESLANAMRRKGYSDQEMFEAGLVKHGKSGGVYDAFRNRLMFPVIDVRGSVIGFSGRILGDGEPKYLNSPETPVFSKSHNLFGLNLAKKSKNGYIILVEGNIDVVSLHQAGFDGAVASLGTSLTPEQARLISRYTNEVVLCYDSDEAGKKAASRGIGILEKLDLKVRVLQVPGAKDPDEFIKKNGADAFRNLIDASAGQIEYRLRDVEAKNPPTTDEGRVDYLKSAASLLASLPGAVEREVYAARVAEKAGVSREAVLQEAERLRRRRIADAKKREARDAARPTQTAQPAQRSIRYDDPRSARAEEGLIRILYLDPGAAKGKTLPPPESFSSPVLARLYRELLRRVQTGETISMAVLAGQFTGDEMSHFTSVLGAPEDLSHADKAISDYIAVITGRTEDAEDDLRALAEKYRKTKSFGG